MKPTPGAVARLAGDLHLNLAQPVALHSTADQAAIAAAAPEVIVVAAYGLILPKSVLAIPSRACLNVHASLLPRWRGAAPVQRAILAGDAETGVAIMAMEAGLDTGPVLLERRLQILPTDTAATLTERLAEAGAEAIVEALERIDALVPVPQDAGGATYAAKIEKSEAVLDWGLDAAALSRRVRAFNPFPGAETILDGLSLKIWEVEPVEVSGPAGTVIGLDKGCPVVACGRGGLVLTVVQRPGSRRMPAAEYLKGHPLLPGTRLGGAPTGGA